MKSIFHNKARAFCFASTLIMSASAMQANAQPLEISAAKELLWDQTQSLYEAIGDANATRGTQSISAQTLRAKYDNSTDEQEINRIIAIDDVRFSDERLSGKGTHLDYDVRQNFYTLKGPGAEINSKDGTAKAKTLLTFDRANGVMTAQDNGEILMNDGRILKGAFIEILLSETEDIKTIDAEGNVFVQQADGKQAFAKSGRYNAETDKAILIGDVKIIDGDSILNGQKAEIDFNSGISRLLAGENSGRVTGTLVSSSD